MGQATIVTGPIVVVATLVLACGDTTAPAPADGDSSTEDASSADAGFGPIPCGDLTCAGATPYCIVYDRCGFGPSDCVTPSSDGGACPKDYDDCQDAMGIPGCVSLYLYSCQSFTDCKQTGPRTYGNCTC